MDWDAKSAAGSSTSANWKSFNSPVGIRWIGTCGGDYAPGGSPKVSIPQSEFDGLGLHSYAGADALDRLVSIPQSEFDGLGRISGRG